jgi:putative oxidoreductase
MNSPVVQFLRQAYKLFCRVADWLQPVFLLVFRLTWGWAFFISGKGKLIHHPDIVDFFASLHIPFPDLNAWFIGGLELVGGVLLALGLASRPIAFVLTGSMVVAYLSVDTDRAKVINIFHDNAPFLQADPFFFLLTAVIVLVFGPGVISVDWLLKKFVFKEPSKAAP